MRVTSHRLNVLPTDLTTGDYIVQASNPNLVTVGSRLTIEGVAVSSEEEEGQRDDEPLLSAPPQGRIMSPVQTNNSVAPVESPILADLALPVIALGAPAVFGLAIAIWRRAAGTR